MYNDIYILVAEQGKTRLKISQELEKIKKQKVKVGTS